MFYREEISMKDFKIGDKVEVKNFMGETIQKNKGYRNNIGW